VSDVVPQSTSESLTSESSNTRPVASKRKAKDTSAADKSVETLTKYFAAKSERLTSKPNDSTTQLDEDDLFARMLATDMKKLSNARIKRCLRKKISDLMFEALEEQDAENERAQQDFAQFFLSQPFN
jgi:hypothetical protein